MIRKIVIGLVIFFGALLLVFTYLNYKNRKASPPGSAEIATEKFVVQVAYSRPYARGRQIFGPDSDEVLQPYGQYWRLGANESTQIRFSQDILFNNEPIAAGAYRFYCFPGPDSFEFRLNTELETWGAFEPDYHFDVLSTKVPVQATDSLVEQFTISFKEIDPAKVNMNCSWNHTTLQIPLKVQGNQEQ